MPSPSNSLNALRSQTLFIYHFNGMKAYEPMYNYAVGPTNLAIALLVSQRKLKTAIMSYRPHMDQRLDY